MRDERSVASAPVPPLRPMSLQQVSVPALFPMDRPAGAPTVVIDAPSPVASGESARSFVLPPQPQQTVSQTALQQLQQQPGPAASPTISALATLGRSDFLRLRSATLDTVSPSSRSVAFSLGASTSAPAAATTSTATAAATTVTSPPASAPGSVSSPLPRDCPARPRSGRAPACEAARCLRYRARCAQTRGDRPSRCRLASVPWPYRSLWGPRRLQSGATGTAAVSRRAQSVRFDGVHGHSRLASCCCCRCWYWESSERKRGGCRCWC